MQIALSGAIMILPSGKILARKRPGVIGNFPMFQTRGDQPAGFNFRTLISPNEASQNGFLLKTTKIELLANSTRLASTVVGAQQLSWT